MSIIVSVNDRMASVIIDREHRRNSLDNEALETLIAAFESFRRQDVTVAVISGKGTKAFCAGSDIKAVAEYSERETQYHTYLLQKCAETLDECPVTTIAAIEGYCLGGGLELALACDYRIASAEAEFGFPEITFHVLATGGATVRLPRAIGLSRAREMLLFGFRIDAEKAMTWNLVSEVVEAGTALAKASEMAKDYAQKIEPFSVAMLKSLLINGYGTGSRVGHTMAYLADCALSQTDAFKHGVDAAANKRR
jgi:enoyl-CoA hydratase/carnithine racemase